MKSNIGICLGLNLLWSAFIGMPAQARSVVIPVAKIITEDHSSGRKIIFEDEKINSIYLGGAPKYNIQLKSLTANYIDDPDSFRSAWFPDSDWIIDVPFYDHDAAQYALKLLKDPNNEFHYNIESRENAHGSFHGSAPQWTLNPASLYLKQSGGRFKSLKLILDEYESQRVGRIRHYGAEAVRRIKAFAQ